MAPCANHPEAETERTCSQCARPFCDRCLVLMLDQAICAGCKQAALLSMHAGRGSAVAGRTAVDPEQFVRWARIYNWIGVFLSLSMVVFYVAFYGPANWNPLGWSEPDLRDVGILAAIAGLAAGLHALAARLLPSRTRGAYYLQWVIAGLALPWFMCGLPTAAGVGMIIYLLKPEIKRHFGLPAAVTPIPVGSVVWSDVSLGAVPVEHPPTPPTPATPPSPPEAGGDTT